MGGLFAMTFPALVVLLVVASVIDVIVTRRRRRQGKHVRPAVAHASLDVLGGVVAPSTRHRLEHDEFQELRRDDEGDAAPPRSTVDLDAGVARIVVPRPPDENGTDRAKRPASA
jgi:hypothetical protein